MKKTKLLWEKWRVLSNKFVRHQRLPYGCEFVMKHSQGRRARNDMTFTRHLFQGRADAKESVSTLISDYLEKALLEKPSARGLRIRLVTPDGREISGQTLVGTVRNLGPIPDQVQVEEQQQREIEIDPEIDEISKLADMQIRNAEEKRDDPEIVVPRGYLRALAARYGINAVNDAVAREIADEG